jgi:uncharacterized protein (TIGR03437 family)
VQPGIFSGAVLHSGTTVSAITTPVRAGEFIEIYCTGLGPTQTVRGLSLTTVTPTVYLGATALSPSFSGLSGFTGLYQVNVQIPAGLPSGTLPLVLASGNAYSNEIKIVVQSCSRGSFPILFQWAPTRPISQSPTIADIG